MQTEHTVNSKISGSSSTPGSYPTFSGAATERAAAAAKSGSARTATPSTRASVADDAVSVTGDAELLRALDEQIAATPAVNAARVAEVRSALANGEYQVDAQRIASKLLATEGGIEALLFRN